MCSLRAFASYPPKQRLCGTIDRYTADLTGKSILDYGCGRSEMSMKYLAAGAEKVSAIEISEVYVEDLRSRAHDAGYPESRCDFPYESFDLVVGYGILHHLEPAAAFSEITA
jgi:2-polyprenyl-3-methyl-5-hydroxy-6-metoxy-1,4-benzoquinol methylase